MHDNEYRVTQHLGDAEEAYRVEWRRRRWYGLYGRWRAVGFWDKWGCYCPRPQIFSTFLAAQEHLNQARIQDRAFRIRQSRRNKSWVKVG